MKTSSAGCVRCYLLLFDRDGRFEIDSILCLCIKLSPLYKLKHLLFAPGWEGKALTYIIVYVDLHRNPEINQISLLCRFIYCLTEHKHD